MKGLLIGGGVVALIVVALVGSYVTAYNSGNSLENQIVATYENNLSCLVSGN